MNTEHGTLLTPGQAATALNVTPRYVRYLADRGRLPKIVLGHRTVRYLESDVLALVTPGPPNDERPDADPGARETNAEATAHDESYSAT